MAEENYKQQMQDSDNIFKAVTSGAFVDFDDAKRAVVAFYAVDMSVSRSGISHALKRLERYFDER